MEGARSWSEARPASENRPCCNECAGERRIHIPHYQYHVWFLAEQNRLEALHDFRRLLGVAARSCAEEHIRGRHLQVRKEGVGHFCVVMLASVDQNRLNRACPFPAHAVELANCLQDWSGLHEIRPRAHDDDNLHPKNHPIIATVDDL